MRSPNRLAFGLAATAAAWCGVVGVWMSASPMMSGGRHPTILQAGGMISVPLLAALGASWAAWHGRHVVVGVMAGLLGLFSLVTGFSIGGAFTPAAGLLIWAMVAGIANQPRASDSDTAV